MSSQTALITGASGLLGRAVTTAFNRKSWSVTGTGLTRANPPAILALDLGDASAVAKTLDDVKPSVVVHCAANRFPDSCDANPNAARALNVAATRSLAELTAKRGVVLIYISTDYVFSGAPGEAPYETSATPAPTNLYGTTKLEGEKAVEEAYAAAGGKGRGVVLRVPVLYGKADKHADSAVNSLVDAVLKAQKEKVVMDGWARRFPTNTEDVARVVADVAALYTSKIEKGEAEGLPSILQFSAEDLFTKSFQFRMFGMNTKHGFGRRLSRGTHNSAANFRMEIHGDLNGRMDRIVTDAPIYSSRRSHPLLFLSSSGSSSFDCYKNYQYDNHKIRHPPPPRHLKLTLPRKPPPSYTGSSAICGSPKSFANNSVAALSGDENGSIARIKGGGKKGCVPNNLDTAKPNHTTPHAAQITTSTISNMADRTEFSPAIPIPFVFDVQARIKALQSYLDPNNPDYQPERQHENIRAVIKLYEEGKIDGLKRTTIIDGKIAHFEEAFTSKTGSWIEGPFDAQRQELRI
ncbi:hypothetical protein V500_11186 [Pseudogymnoascus sp. VKM F-4518 (FW-2643)]|nr:hypothetical protein V500_11186 [Pseudogymnoascus sp. VKM F-4518 (FW-2643)]